MTLPITLLESLPASSFLELLRDSSMKISYSQFGEDASILHLLQYSVKKLHGGFYVDVGAFHPTLFSNTKLLHILGWRGINIDANEACIDLFRAARPNDINVCCGVGKEENELTYYQFAGGAMNTFSAELAETWRTKNGWQQVGTKAIKVRRINDILRETMPPSTAIDYMNIDLEGLDRDVLEDLDLDAYGPTILSVELHDSDIANLAKDRAVRGMAARGYVLKAVHLVTAIFIRNEYA